MQVLRFWPRDLHPVEFDDVTHLENAALSTRLRFTSNPALVILLGAVIVVTSCYSEMAFRYEKSPPLSTLLSGLIPELLLVAVTARALIQLRRLQSHLQTVQDSFAVLRPLSASLGQCALADRSNLRSLHDAARHSACTIGEDLLESIFNSAVSFEHTYSIAQRLGITVQQLDGLLNPARRCSGEKTSVQSRFESQHSPRSSLTLRTLPNGSLDRGQIVELR